MNNRTESAVAAPGNLFFLRDEPLDPGHAGNAEIMRLAKRLHARFEHIPESQPGPGAEPHEESRYNPGERPYRGPFTCAVYGAWGSGKTSLLRALERQFDAHESITVWFEPWRYENEQQLLVPLLVEFNARIHRVVRNEQIKRAALDTGKKLVGRVAKGVLRTASSVIKAHVGIDPYEIGEEFFKQYGEQNRDWSEATSEVQQFKADFRDLIGIASTKAFRNPDTGFKRAASLAKAEPRIPVAVFIDDLDRCNPEQVRRLLESIKLFLHEPGVYFFLALDEEQVLHAMAEPYKSYFPDHPNMQVLANALAKRYLEKFFQYAIDVGDSSLLLSGSVESLRTELWQAVAGELDPADRDTLEPVFRAVKSNPRALKRAARWLYFEGAGVHGSTLVPRFAEEVLSINWETEWVDVFMGEGLEAKRRCYEACARLLDGLEWTGDPPRGLIELQSRLLLLDPGAAGSDMVPGQTGDPWADDFESQQILGAYPTLTLKLRVLLERGKTEELQKLGVVFDAARGLA